jgi:hypothetical protein
MLKLRARDPRISQLLGDFAIHLIPVHPGIATFETQPWIVLSA